MRRAGHRGALATIVHTNGSIPSYESSRMLVREDGSIAGTIGGGRLREMSPNAPADLQPVWRRVREASTYCPGLAPQSHTRTEGGNARVRLGGAHRAAPWRNAWLPAKSAPRLQTPAGCAPPRRV